MFSNVSHSCRQLLPSMSMDDGDGREGGRSERRDFSDLAGVFGIDEMFASLLTSMQLTLHTAK